MTLRLLLISLLSVLLIGCSGAERSAGMAFDNANSVLKSGDGKIWGPADQDLNEDGDDRRAF